MRILCIDGAYFAGALRQLGHQTLCVGASSGVDVPLARTLSLQGLLALLEARGFAPEAAIWCDTCKPPMVAGLESLPWPTVAYSIDQYYNPWHVSYSAGFDAVLVAQKDYVPLFAAEHPRAAAWMPLFCDPSVMQGLDVGAPRDIPVSFVGSLNPMGNPVRKPFLDAFSTFAPLTARTGAYAPVFARSRLALNQSAAGELNFRVFEAMCCGAALLTEDAENGLAELFALGEDLLVYPRGDAAAAARVALAALRSEKLADIAAAGREKVLRRHTVTARAKTLLAWLVRLHKEGAPARRLAQGRALRRRMANAYTILALDEQLPLTPEHRQFYLELAQADRA